MPIGTNVELYITLNESLTASSTTLKKPNKLLSETITGTDTNSKGSNKLLTETFTGTEVVNKGPSRTLSETSTLTDTISKGPNKFLSESIAPSDTFLRALGKLLTETSTLTDTKNVAAQRTITESFTGTDTDTYVQDKTKKFFTDTLTATDSMIRYYISERVNNARTSFQQAIIDNGFGGVLARETQTADTMSGVTSVATTNYNIYVWLQDITLKDRKIHDMGFAVPGNVKGFFFFEYPNSITGNGTLIVKAGDIVTDKLDNTWRIEQVLGEREMGNGVLFIVGILKKLNLSQP